ncbi:MAG: hypothetical protein KDA78_01950, partial [Planctomycetaceae bacterium]|nr:hypothetical protein [Planctomycetaceae bacterium]
MDPGLGYKGFRGGSFRADYNDYGGIAEQKGDDREVRASMTGISGIQDRIVSMKTGKGSNFFIVTPVKISIACR